MIDRDHGEESLLIEEQEIYRENILDHYKHPQNVGTLKDYSCRHRELNPLCGDEVEVFIKIDGDNMVSDAKFVGQGCAISQAAIDILSEEIKNKSVTDVKKMTKEHVLEMLGIPLSVVRMKCALLSLKTIHNSLEKLS